MGKLLENFFQDKTILITGHTGFKGSWLALWLRELGAKVIGYSLEPDSQVVNFAVTGLKNDIIDITGDIRDLCRLEALFGIYKPEIVFHFAGQQNKSTSYIIPKETFEINLMGTVNVLECIRRKDFIKAAVLTTSDGCYENTLQLWGHREDEPLGGDDPYNASKGSCEFIINSYRKSLFTHGKGSLYCPGIASARIGDAIGGGDWSSGRLVPDCIRTLVKGEKIRVDNPGYKVSLQHVLEQLYGCLLLAKELYLKPERYSGAWNFGPDTAEIRTVLWVVKELCKSWGDGADYFIENTKNIPSFQNPCLDCSKAKRMLGWSPKWDTELALNKMVEWAKAFTQGEDMRNVCAQQIKEYLSRGRQHHLYTNL
jgi:CDP-glucose 4,6-dehydratase